MQQIRPPGARLDLCGLSRYKSAAMKPLTSLILALGMSCALAGAQNAEYRTFTNAQGKSIQAKMVGVNGPNVTIQMADGRQFTLAIASLSAADQQFIKSAPGPAAAPAAGFKPKAGPNDKIEPATLNEIAGQPLFGDTILWESSAEEVAKRLNLPPESKTKISSSFRAYTKDDYMLFGAHPYSVAMYAENDKVTGFSLVYANKGDLFSAKGGGEMHFDKDTPPAKAATIVKTAMDKDVAAITAALTKKLGEPKKERIGDSVSVRVDTLRWDWRGHSILLADEEGEYVGIQIVPSSFADNGGKVEDTVDKVIRARALANIEKREHGDVVIGDIPMVDQGPKGYCAPATAERAMRFLGIPADMYIIANKGNTGFGGGTSMQAIFEGMAKQIRSKQRSFDSWQGELKLKELQKHIDKGVPVIWTLYSTDDFNKTANDRTKARKDVTNWAEWKTKVAGEAASSPLRKDRESGHVVLIIGYNKDTNEIAFSDSWGERYKERWITLPEAEMVSQGFFYTVGF
ncbi:MAG: C39 family peptidase [Verrucomicrobiaceae bacterium]|nr:C39 family peptidase [Verrucomicrobiaceae bacterium]